MRETFLRDLATRLNASQSPGHMLGSLWHEVCHVIPLLTLTLSSTEPHICIRQCSPFLLPLLFPLLLPSSSPNSPSSSSPSPSFSPFPSSPFTYLQGVVGAVFSERGELRKGLAVLDAQERQLNWKIRSKENYIHRLESLGVGPDKKDQVGTSGHPCCPRVGPPAGAVRPLGGQSPPVVVVQV